MSSAAGAGNLRAGVARVEITPAADELPFPARNLPPFVSVHDPVFARALVLDDGVTEVAFVIVDVTQIPEPDQFSKSIADALGIPPGHFILAASHTHSEPLVNYHNNESDPAFVRRLERVREGAVKAAKEAKAQLQPARIAFARGEGWVNINNGQGGPLLEQGDPHGPSDKSLDLIRVQTAVGSTIALLVDFGVPGTVMLDSAAGNGGQEVTADLIGLAAQLVEKSLSDHPVVLFASSADGDQRPLYRALQIAGHMPAADEGAGAWGALDVQARSLANATMVTLDKMPDGAANVKLAASATTVECPGQRRRVNPKTGQVTVQDAPSVKIPLNIIRIGDIAVGGVGGNVATEIGEKFKTASPAKYTTMITVTSGTVGYILTDAEYEHVGHNAGGSPLKPGCAENSIVQGLVDLEQTKP
jgi:hypothetical protein